MQFKKTELQNFIGRGITLPLQLTNGRPALDTGLVLIRASIQLILAWQYGTRFFLIEFGSRIDELLEEPNDDVLKGVIYTFVVDALAQWEKRIELMDVRVERTTNLSNPSLYTGVNITINYRIINTKFEDTFTFPFYRQIIY